MDIKEMYELKCATPSDINEHLEALFQFSKDCDHITEFGVRNPTSTYAYLHARPKKFICYDIGKYPEVDEAERLAKEEGIDFTFILQDVLQADIEETDFLSIDTFHSSEQLRRELKRHAHKVRKRIFFHDCFTFGRCAESPYPGVPAEVCVPEGLMFAIEEFLEAHPEWKIVHHVDYNNGAMIIERI